MATKICNFCHESIDENAEFCIFCGNRQTTISNTKNQVEVNPADKKNVKKADTTLKKTVGHDLFVPEVVDEKSVVLQNEKKDKELRQKQKMAKKEIEKLKEKAYTDSLTHLKNRLAYEEDIANFKAKDLCVVSIDANNLKLTNDNLGHSYGDTFLKTIANCITQSFGSENIYRIGGDEFICFLDGIGPAAVKTMTDKLHSLLSEAELKLEIPFEMSVSIGASFGDGTKTVNQLIEEADTNMYLDKKEQKKIKNQEETKQNINNENGQVSDENVSLSVTEDYNSNFDGYYDDVAFLIEDEERKIDKEAIKKTVMLVVIVFVAVMAFEFMIM